MTKEQDKHRLGENRHFYFKVVIVNQKYPELPCDVQSAEMLSIIYQVMKEHRIHSSVA